MRGDDHVGGLRPVPEPRRRRALHGLLAKLSGTAADGSSVRSTDASTTTPLDLHERRFVVRALWAGVGVCVVLLALRLIAPSSGPAATGIFAVVAAATAVTAVTAWMFGHGRLSTRAIGVLAFLIVPLAPVTVMLLGGVTRSPDMVALTTSSGALLVALSFLTFPRRTARALHLALLACWLLLLVPTGLLTTDLVLVLAHLFVLGAVLDLMVGVGLRHQTAAQHGREMAARDELTGLCNRRGALGVLADLGPGDGLLIVDLDGFKSVNDEHGHLAGDEVLATVGRVLARSIRDDDLAVRWGGEEFLVVVPTASTTANAALLCERVRAAIEVADTGVTASVGAAVLQAGEDWQAALGRADDALYRAKAGGRNRSMLAS